MTREGTVITQKRERVTWPAGTHRSTEPDLSLYGAVCANVFRGETAFLNSERNLVTIVAWPPLPPNGSRWCLRSRPRHRPRSPAIRTDSNSALGMLGAASMAGAK